MFFYEVSAGLSAAGAPYRAVRPGQHRGAGETGLLYPRKGLYRDNPAYCEPLIPPEEFERIQESLTERSIRDYVTKKVLTAANERYITATVVCTMLRKISAEYAGTVVHLVLDNARYQK